MYDDYVVTKNAGGTDRVVRGVLAGTLIAAPLLLKTSPVVTTICAAYGGVMAVEALTGYCPAYDVTGISTLKVK